MDEEQVEVLNTKLTWKRSDITLCNCFNTEVHVHCPCIICCYRPVHRSTEHRHWQRSLDCNNVNVDIEDESSVSDSISEDSEHVQLNSINYNNSADIIDAANTSADDISINETSTDSTSSSNLFNNGEFFRLVK